MNVTPELRARMDVHLDAVEKALMATGHSRERRRGVVDDLEAQIREMLAAKSESPTLADLEEVLAKLDPPAAYGEGSARTVPPPFPPRPAAAGSSASSAAPGTPPSAAVASPVRVRYSRAAIWGLVCIIASILPVPVMLVAALFFAVRTVAPTPHTSRPPQVVNGPEVAPMDPQSPAIEELVTPDWLLGAWSSLACIFALIGPLAITGTVLGWVAFGQIRRSAGMIRGTGMALFDGLFYPALFLIFSVITPFFLPIVGLILMAACIAIIILVVRVARGQRAFG